MSTFRTISAFVIGAVAATVGCAIAAHHAIRDYEAAPAAIIGVMECDKWEGAVIVTHDGALHPLPGLDSDAATMAARGLGAGHGMLLHIPCEGQGT